MFFSKNGGILGIWTSGIFRVKLHVKIYCLGPRVPNAELSLWSVMYFSEETQILWTRLLDFSAFLVK